MFQRRRLATAYNERRTPYEMHREKTGHTQSLLKDMTQDCTQPRALLRNGIRRKMESWSPWRTEQRQRRKLWRIRTKLGPGAVVRAKVTSRTCRSSSRDGHRFEPSKAAPTPRIGGGGAGKFHHRPRRRPTYLTQTHTHTRTCTHTTHPHSHTRPVISRPWSRDGLTNGLSTRG